MMMMMMMISFCLVFEMYFSELLVVLLSECGYSITVPL